MSIPELIEIAKEFAREYYYLAAFIVLVLGVVFGSRSGFWHRAGEKIRDFWRTDIRELKREKAEIEARLTRVRDAFDDDNNLWLRQPIAKPAQYDASFRKSIPILLVANLKGGVGKTTIAANLAAFFETKKRERVLAIDLDHQGSLSSMLLPEAQRRSHRSADAVKSLIRGSPDCHLTFFSGSVPIRNTTKDSRLIDCDDPFANFETRLVLEWLIGDTKNDIRYNLARVLHSAEVQRNFDRVIIDAPPRITTGLVNALCASTHLVVPFVLDTLSAERVGLFLGTVSRMKGQLFPHLALAAVVGTMKGDGTGNLRDAEREALAEADQGVMQNWDYGDYVWKDTLIPRRQKIADTAGYGVDDATVAIFEPLGNKMFARTSRGGPTSPEPPDAGGRAPREGRHEHHVNGGRPA